MSVHHLLKKLSSTILFQSFTLWRLKFSSFIIWICVSNTISSTWVILQFLLLLMQAHGSYRLVWLLQLLIFFVENPNLSRLSSLFLWYLIWYLWYINLVILKGYFSYFTFKYMSYCKEMFRESQRYKILLRYNIKKVSTLEMQ